MANTFDTFKLGFIENFDLIVTPRSLRDGSRGGTSATQ